jgi:ABC-type transport system involved in multi-copper enzyme maturation permease subunit
MDKILVIAKNTYREAVRDKILYNIVFISLALLLFSIFLGDWAVFDRDHVIKSFALSLMSLSGMALCVFVGIAMIQRELQKKTVLTLLSKPMPRGFFLLGKYLGLIGVLITHLAVMTTMLFFILWASDNKPDIVLLQGVFMIFWEISLIISVAVLFSSFSTPILSSLFTFGVYLAGHLSAELMRHLDFLKKSGQFQTMTPGEQLLMEQSSTWVYNLFPNLDQFYITEQILYDGGVKLGYLFNSSLNALGYIGLFLSVALWWFSKKDFI